MATANPRLLLEAARAAGDGGNAGYAVVTTRALYPQLEARKPDDLPREVWEAAFPMPYSESIRSAATRAGVDPWLVAGLIRQESAFSRDAVSRANAIGLMQLLPKTARLLAREEKVAYARSRLTDPEYNLRLGSVYYAGLRRRFGTDEAALAAYNAGDDRVSTWQAVYGALEPAEFVESIPFTETREYVQIVIRNAGIYRRLYGSKQ